MTIDEAIKELKIQFVGEYDRQREAKDMAIKALQEHQHYKDLAESYGKTINKLTKAIAEQASNSEKANKWISTSDSMPIIGQDVLVCDLDGNMYITSLHLDGRWGFDYCGNKIKNVVAWQELPEAYKLESEDNNE